MSENSGKLPLDVEKALMTLTVVLIAETVFVNVSKALSVFLGERRALTGLWSPVGLVFISTQSVCEKNIKILMHDKK